MRNLCPWVRRPSTIYGHVLHASVALAALVYLGWWPAFGVALAPHVVEALIRPKKRCED